MKKYLLGVCCALVFCNLSYGQTQPPNAGFENWDDFGDYEEPTDWSSANECSDILGIYSSGKTSNDVHSGTFAARLVTANSSNGLFKINGLIATSTMICDPLNPGNKDGRAYFERPDSIVGWYKYSPVDTDNGYVQVLLMDTGAASVGSIDTVGFIKHDFIGAQPQWKRFSAPINYRSSGLPNLCAILFNSSYGNGNNNEAFAGSELIVDDIGLIFNPAGINEENDASEWRLYPNPATEYVNVSIGREGVANLELFDITGKSLLNKSVRALDSKIEVSRLPAGVYVYQFTSEENLVLRTGKLFVTK